MPIRALCVFILFACTGGAAALTLNNDYHAARETGSGLAQLLIDVEKYHLEPGIILMRTKTVDGVRGGGYLHRALGHARYVLKYFPNHPRALLLAVEVCEVWKDSKECNLDVAFDDALRIRRNDAGVYLVKAIYLQKRKRITEAIDSYKKSIEINPRSANAHYNLALAYLTQKQNALANEHAQRAYALGMMLPGLKDRLVAEKAWKPIESKPGTEPAASAGTAESESEKPTPEPIESQARSNDDNR